MWEYLIKVVDDLAVMIRVVLSDGTRSEWSKWFAVPSDSYGEVMGYGPFLLKNVDYFEINPIELRRLGRLVPEKQIDHSSKLEAALREFDIHFEKIGSIYRISAN